MNQYENQLNWESKGKTNILHSALMIEQLEKSHFTSTFHQSCMTKESKDMFWLLNHLLKRHHLVCNEIFAFLIASLHAAKLVLDAIKGIYHLHLSRKGADSDEIIAWLGCSLLFELLIKASPYISPQVSEEAMMLASDD